VGIVRRLRIEDRTIATVLSFVEMIVFFGVISTAYFALMCGAYVRIAAWADTDLLQGVGYGDWPGLLPAWMWIVSGLLYLLLITLYWAPSQDAQVNQAELRGFVLFLVVIAVVALVVFQIQSGFLTKLAETYRSG